MRTVLLSISDNQGYAPDQIETSMTLGKLLELLEEAIEDWGADSKLVLSNGQRYGAGYGRIVHSGWENCFRPDTEDDDEEAIE